MAPPADTALEGGTRDDRMCPACPGEQPSELPDSSDRRVGWPGDPSAGVPDMSSASPIPQVRENSVAFVVTSGANVGTRLGRGLTRGGSRVAVLEDTPVGEASDGIGRYLISFASRAQVLHAFDAAVADLGSPQLVVLSALPADLFVPTDSASISPGDWASAVQGAAKITLYCLQAAYAHMVKSGGG